MDDYSNEELERMIKEQGFDLDELQSGPLGAASETERIKQGLTAPTEGKVSPFQIMTEVRAQGIKIPVAQIGRFLVCVLKGIWTQPLPVAVATCAKSFM